MTIDFGDDSFNSELLWRQLKAFKSQRLPMGCGTAPDPDLKEVGLICPQTAITPTLSSPYPGPDPDPYPPCRHP